MNIGMESVLTFPSPVVRVSSVLPVCEACFSVWPLNCGARSLDGMESGLFSSIYYIIT